MTIEVTAEDILLGEKMICSKCPIARAVRRTIGTSFVWANSVYIEAGDERRWKTPMIAQEFMVAFDNSRPVAPFSFTLP